MPAQDPLSYRPKKIKKGPGPQGTGLTYKSHSSGRKMIGPRSHRPIISAGIPDRKALQGPRARTSTSGLNAWKPVISKEMGAGIRRGDTFTTLSGKTMSLGTRRNSGLRKRRSR